MSSVTVAAGGVSVTVAAGGVSITLAEPLVSIEPGKLVSTHAVLIGVLGPPLTPVKLVGTA